jgi:hypothetical protein
MSSLHWGTYSRVRLAEEAREERLAPNTQDEAEAEESSIEQVSLFRNPSVLLISQTLNLVDSQKQLLKNCRFENCQTVLRASVGLLSIDHLCRLLACDDRVPRHKHSGRKTTVTENQFFDQCTMSLATPPSNAPG